MAGGFFAAGQYAFGGVAAAGLILLPWVARGAEHLPPLTDPVLAGLLLIAAANAVAAVAAGRTDTIAPTWAVCAWPVVYVLASLPRRSPTPAAIVVAVTGASACAGLTALAVRTGPDAERIAGIWRAGGTYEYPPALALACVCGLACALGLTATGAISRRTGFVMAALFCMTVALTYDRAGAVMAAGVLLLFGRIVGGRRVIIVAVVGIALGLVTALVLARPNLRQLERHVSHGTITSRSDPWSDAWRGIRRRPALGYGPGGYPRIYLGSADATRTGRAHDTVLEQTVEAGVAAGLGALVVTVAGLGRALPRLSNRDPMTLAWACVGTAVIASGLYDFTWSFPPLAAVGLIALARLGPSTDRSGAEDALMR